MTYNKKSVEDIDVAGKRVLVRCDFNVPLKDGVITDEKRPAAVVLGGYIMDYIAGDHGTGLLSEKIHAAHIGEHALAEIVDMVFLDPVVVRVVVGVSPDPAAGNACVKKIGNLVVFHDTVMGVHHENPARREIPSAASVDGAIRDGAVVGFVRGSTASRAACQTEAARAAVVESHVCETHAAASLVDAHTVESEMREVHVIDDAVFRVPVLDRAACVGDCLCIGCHGTGGFVLSGGRAKRGIVSHRHGHIDPSERHMLCRTLDSPRDPEKRVELGNVRVDGLRRNGIVARNII